jgi:hypothetical protein
MPNLKIPAKSTPNLKINPDLIESGNIDLKKRPKIKNLDGSISTIRSINVEMDGMHFLIPTVIGDKIVSNEEAIEHFKKTRQHLGVYKSQQAAKIAGERLSAEQKRYYGL